MTVEFVGLEDEAYYVTLLSEQAGNGPWGAEKGYQDWYENRVVWEKFREYASGSDLYFWGYFEECSETDVFSWNYYPPERFKVLLYFPETDIFLESEESCWPGFFRHFSEADGFADIVYPKGTP